MGVGGFHFFILRMVSTLKIVRLNCVVFILIYCDNHLVFFCGIEIRFKYSSIIPPSGGVTLAREHLTSPVLQSLVAQANLPPAGSCAKGSSPTIGQTNFLAPEFASTRLS